MRLLYETSVQCLALGAGGTGQIVRLVAAEEIQAAERCGALGVSPGEPMDHVDVVRALLEQERGGVLPGCMPVVVVEIAAEADEVAHPHRFDLADGARFDDFLHHAEDVHVAHVEADHQPRARCVPGVQDAVAAVDGDRHRLLAEDVLAGLQRGDRVLLMAVVGRGDGDRVDVGSGDQLAIVLGDERVAAVFAAERFQVFRDDIRPAYDHRAPFGVVPVAPQPAAAVDADHADAQLGD